MTMTDLPKLIVLDVAHGNCSILQDTKGSIIIDCAHGDTLIETLKHLKIKEIDRIMISHADQDHFKGFIDLLSDETIIVKHVHLNPDAKKDTHVLKALRLAISDAKKRNNTSHEYLDTDMTGKLNVGEVRIEVLAPNKEIMGYSGSKDLQGKSLTSNSVSAVIRLVYKSRGVALLAGDIDRVGLDNLLRDSSEIGADILIFPHHGGNTGVGREKENQEFTVKLCQHVKPKLALFSIGRDKHQNPRKEVVKTILDTLPDVHILCTQLSKHCSSATLAIDPIHLNTLPSKGREANYCCGGTVVINLNETETTYAPNSDHRQFIKENVLSALCRIEISSPTETNDKG
jgi:beta-lactamase superfamily II metal-dependent hydrolase